MAARFCRAEEWTMPAITYRPVSDVNFEKFTAAFNRAYSDYYVHVAMTPAGFRDVMEHDDLDPAASVAALDGDHVVGTGLLGIRAQVGWIGGMGVIPGYRRQGIGRQMMGILLDRARERHLGEVTLEVIEANRGAYALYTQFGFKDGRRLLILNRNPDSAPDLAVRFEIEDRPAPGLLRYYEPFHTTPNPWQRGLRSLQGLAPQLQGWAMLDGPHMVGYALGRADTYDIRILDIATAPDSDPVAVTQALLTRHHRRFPDAYGVTINLAEDDPALPAFEKLGYTRSLRQIEMRLPLT
jgi:ribosomal protein S18 acetylase RimI-like enzyme